MSPLNLTPPPSDASIQLFARRGHKAPGWESQGGDSNSSNTFLLWVIIVILLNLFSGLLLFFPGDHSIFFNGKSKRIK